MNSLQVYREIGGNHCLEVNLGNHHVGLSDRSSMPATLSQTLTKVLQSVNWSINDVDVTYILSAQTE
jgi:hypothetical protein